LTWKCTFTSSVVLTEGTVKSVVAATGEKKDLKPAGTTVYTLTGTGLGGSVTRSASVLSPDIVLRLEGPAGGGGGCSLVR
jgi:hypothetical protein